MTTQRGAKPKVDCSPQTEAAASRAGRSERIDGLRLAGIALTAWAVISFSAALLGCATGAIPTEDRQNSEQRYGKDCRGRLCEPGR
jgi:hypothetical protein